RIGLRRQRTHRAEIDDVGGELRGERLLDVSGDLHVLSTAGSTELLDARHLGQEPDAARAVNAAVHLGGYQWAEILLLDRALVLDVAPAIEAIGHGLVLQVAFATLVTDRAIQRMVDEQEFHHSVARLAGAF